MVVWPLDEGGLVLFEEFFGAATRERYLPYAYQVRVAREGLPAVVVAPTGAGKTGIVLAWLWRLLHGAPSVTPRRLVYALPQRSLVEQVADDVTGWLANLSLSGEVALHIVMGGAASTQRQWRMDMHRPAILVGTVDSLVSKALNRGYGIGRATYPIDFALVTNGAHWVVDEVQLCPESTTTMRQVVAFTAGFSTAEPFGLTCMSATVPAGLLDTVDNPEPGPEDVLTISADDRVGGLARRLAGQRTVRRLPVDARSPTQVAAAVLQRHRPGTLTLVVVNTARAARSVYEALRHGDVDVPRVLLHSRFRAADRSRLVKEIREPVGCAGRVVVATQVVEAGLDLDAAVLVTEAAPWPSIVQRAGRCNRAGETADAELWWLPPVAAKPYEQDDVDAAADELVAMEGVTVTGEQLQDRSVRVSQAEVLVLRRPDFVGLFDTAPDLSGGDVDIAPYVRDADELDVQVAWAVWDGDGAPPTEAVAPGAADRCRVPLGALKEFRTDLWRRDQAVGRWVRVTGQRPARPGEVLVVAASAGGYDPEVGFDPAVRGVVVDAPRLMDRVDRSAGVEEPFGEDAAGDCVCRWVSVDQHGAQTRDQAQALIATIGPALPGGVAEAAVRAAYAHDGGKCHKVWQDAVCALAPAEQRAEFDEGPPWAKSPVNGQLRLSGGFRHELVSWLLLDGPLAGLLAGVSDGELVRYLVLAHHGKLRVQVRGTGDDPGGGVLGLVAGEVMEMPAMLGQPAGMLEVDLAALTLGGQRSWTRTALALRDRYGPFVLVYLETLVRIADWRASAGQSLPVAPVGAGVRGG